MSSVESRYSNPKRIVLPFHMSNLVINVQVYQFTCFDFWSIPSYLWNRQIWLVSSLLSGDCPAGPGDSCPDNIRHNTEPRDNAPNFHTSHSSGPRKGWPWSHNISDLFKSHVCTYNVCDKMYLICGFWILQDLLYKHSGYILPRTYVSIFRSNSLTLLW